MDKYLVFRLERTVSSGEGFNLTESCFELVKEFEVPDLTGIDRDEVWKAYMRAVGVWADQYSKDHNLRTVVIKGSVFGY